MLDSALAMRDGSCQPRSARRRTQAAVGTTWVAFVFVVLLAPGCGRAAEEAAPAASTPATAGASASASPAADSAPADEPTAGRTGRQASLISAEEAERLAAIGYNEFAEGGDPDERGGVVLHDRERACPGYNLYAVIPLNVAELVDMEGELVNRWSTPGGLWLSRCELLPSGDVLIVGTRGDPAHPSHYLACLSWTGEVRWISDARAHHDVELTPRGEVLALVTRPRPVPGIDPTRDVQDNLLTLFTLDQGRAIAEVSLADALLTSERPLVFQDDVMIHTRFEGADWLHANSVEWMPWPDLAGTSPLYDRSNVLVSLRHQSVIAIVNWERRDLVWWWGRGELRRQHEATWLPDGNILVFDNGDETRRRSRILKVDPRQDRIVWQWTAPEPGDFYSRGQGTAQALPNGSVLVGHSAGGEAFEIAPDGSIVWRLLDPYHNGKGQRASLRIKRYEPALVDGLIERRGRRGG